MWAKERGNGVPNLYAFPSIDVPKGYIKIWSLKKSTSGHRHSSSIEYFFDFLTKVEWQVINKVVE